MLVHARRLAAFTLAVAFAISAAHAQSLTTSTSNNGSGGIYLDLTPAGPPVTLNTFASYFASAAGAGVTVEVWTRPGSYVGFTASNVGWTLSQTITGNSAGTTTLSAPFTLTTPLVLPAGGTTGILLQSTTAGGGFRYNGTGTTAVTTYSNADITLFSSVARVTAVAFAGTEFTPRCFAGTITYSVGNPNAMGACCTAIADCTFGTAAACTTSGGFFSGEGTSCNPNLCGHHGSCCSTTTNACTLSASGAAGCGSGTTYQGDGSSCSPNICPQGACCNNTTGVCTLTAPTGCLAGSTYQNNGTLCTPIPCPPPANNECSGAVAVTVGTQIIGSNVNATDSGAGVVATNTGSCTQTTLATGTHLDVWYRLVAPATAAYTIDTCGSAMPDTVLSIHSGCPANASNILDCNDDSSSPTGNVACTSSTLNSRIQSVGLTAGQTYYIGVAGYNGGSGQFNLLVSFVNTTGSCCSGAACTLADAANCTGTFTSGGSCSPNPCAPPGVCCRGSTCTTSITTSAACTASLVAGQTAGAAFPTGSLCNTSPVSGGLCCYANYNKTGGITVQDIFDFLADWFANSPFANTGGNGSPAPLAVQNIFDFLSDWFTGGC